jgi:hypothetical protein
MKGATEYAKLFPGNHQFGRLYLKGGKHARGETFHVFVLPEGRNAMKNGPGEDAVEVYGILGGQPGWTEYYGWLRKGLWCDDFEKIVNNRKKQIENERREYELADKDRQDREARRTDLLLMEYERSRLDAAAEGVSGE